ncbi:unnamed protein product [Brassica oleracea var. botrytis]|uniref:BnaC04g18810D protein n=3 Tax=Brassica TaxID=3705 RepID=A0A078GPP7_BRANA|nr:hypothetical protein HID58_060076 [Brassica napus]CAF1836622.1 unnamed protein product [Brassica napus]CDY27301.1 BnaC04g18810D [Brassica napus]VDD08716.1 unnamed protein product [Brassica oleracea]
MLSKGQGRTMGSHFSLLNALAEDNRLDEAEELWNKLFMEHLEGTPRKFFNQMISIYYKREIFTTSSSRISTRSILHHSRSSDIKGRRVKVKAKQLNELSEGEGGLSSDEDNTDNEIESVMVLNGVVCVEKD